MSMIVWIITANGEPSRVCLTEAAALDEIRRRSPVEPKQESDDIWTAGDLRAEQWVAF